MPILLQNALSAKPFLGATAAAEHVRTMILVRLKVLTGGLVVCIKVVTHVNVTVEKANVLTSPETINLPVTCCRSLCQSWREYLILAPETFVPVYFLAYADFLASNHLQLHA